MAKDWEGKGKIEERKLGECTACPSPSLPQIAQRRICFPEIPPAYIIERKMTAFVHPLTSHWRFRLEACLLPGDLVGERFPSPSCRSSPDHRACSESVGSRLSQAPLRGTAAIGYPSPRCVGVDIMGLAVGLITLQHLVVGGSPSVG